MRSPGTTGSGPSGEIPLLDQPVFETQRLRVFATGIVISQVLCTRRELFVAFWPDFNRVLPIATALLSNHADREDDTAGWHVDWIEVASDYRRQGIATELLHGIERYLGTQVSIYPGSDRRVRVKDAVDMVWWFGKTPWPKADNRRVLRPYSDSMKHLIRYGCKPAKRPSGHEISTKFQRDNGGAIPGNLLEIANTESNSAYLRRCRNRRIPAHPARYPEKLVEFFVNFLTDEGDLVVDPFAGSNVTGAVCEKRGRRWISVEIVERYVEGSILRFEDAALLATGRKRKRSNAKP